MFVKVNYTIGNYQKFVEGELLKETDSYILVRDRNGNKFEIYRSTILEVVRYESREAQPS